MADSETSTSRKSGFDWQHPGMKEYAVVFGVVFAGAALWFWYKQKQAASAQTTQTPSTTTAGTPVVLAGAGGGGVPFGALYAALQNFMSSPQTVSASSPGPGGTTGPAQSNTVPKVTGLTVTQAEQTLNASNFAAGTAGGQSPSSLSSSATVVSQTPAAGTKVSYGSNYWPSGSSQPFVDIGT